MDPVHDSRVSQTGCGYDPRIGASWPCGIMISSGCDCAHTHVITTKKPSALNKYNDSFEVDNQSSRMVRTLQAELNKAWLKTNQRSKHHQGQYDNRLKFKLKVQTQPYDQQEVLRNMGASETDDINTNPGLKAALAPLLAELPPGYRLVAFRQK